MDETLNDLISDLNSILAGLDDLPLDEAMELRDDLKVVQHKLSKVQKRLHGRTGHPDPDFELAGRNSAESLKSILGDQFGSLVETDIVYSVRPGAAEVLMEMDSETRRAVLSHLVQVE